MAALSGREVPTKSSLNSCFLGWMINRLAAEGEAVTLSETIRGLKRAASLSISQGLLLSH